MVSNIHTHTHYCDGGKPPRDYVLAAIERKLTSLGFSVHAPVPFDCNWAIPKSRLTEYFEEINNLKAEFESQIEIYVGAEIDYFPDIVGYTNDLIKSYPFDYFIGSLHFIDKYEDGRRWTIDGPHEEFKNGFSEVFGNDSIMVTRKFFEYSRKMIQDLNPHVIGHLDKLKMQYRPDCFIPEDHPVFKEELLKTLEVISLTECIVEINTRGIYKKRGDTFYPGSWALHEMSKLGIKIMVNSDAHLPHELVNEFDNAFSALQDAGHKEHYILKGRQFIPVPITNKKNYLFTAK